MNPALALGKIWWILARDGGCPQTRHAWVFVIAPLVGAVVASLYRNHLSDRMILMKPPPDDSSLETPEGFNSVSQNRINLTERFSRPSLR